MVKYLLILMGFLAFTPAAIALDDCNNFYHTRQKIRDLCQKEWPNDYRMQEYCMNEQNKAVSWLKNNTPIGVPHGIHMKIREKCCKDWSNDYRMRKYCETEQINAYLRLNR